MSIIIGIDHGYYAIKTAHCSFPAGLTSYGEHEPYTRQGLLEFGGCFFVCGTGRQPIQRDKTVNDNYYLLTLAAIAKEIRQRGLPPECSVRIAAGLPLTSFGRDNWNTNSALQEMPIRQLCKYEKLVPSIRRQRDFRKPFIRRSSARSSCTVTPILNSNCRTDKLCKGKSHEQHENH